MEGVAGVGGLQGRLVGEDGGRDWWRGGIRVMEGKEEAGRHGRNGRRRKVVGL